MQPSSHQKSGTVKQLLSAADQRLQALLADGTIRLLSCDWLRNQPDGFVVPRNQEAPADALLPPAAAASAFGAGDRRVGVGDLRHLVGGRRLTCCTPPDLGWEIEPLA